MSTSTESAPLIHNEAISYQEFSDNVSESGERCCRFCFDGEEAGELFSPCRCSGSQAYVHRTCLDEWRAGCPHENGFYECCTCKYRYQIGEFPPHESIFRKFNRFLAQHYFFFLALNISVIFLGGNIMAWLDKDLKVAKEMKHLLEPHLKMSSPMVYYWLIMAYAYIAIIGLFFLINLAFTKNRKLYLKHILGTHLTCGCIRLAILLVLIVVCFLFNILLGMLMLTLELQVLMTCHYRYLDRLYRANHLQVQPYDPNKDKPAEPVRIHRPVPIRTRPPGFGPPDYPGNYSV